MGEISLLTHQAPPGGRQPPTPSPDLTVAAHAGWHYQARKKKIPEEGRGHFISIL